MLCFVCQAERDYRIIVLNTAQSDSYTILCEVSRLLWQLWKSDNIHMYPSKAFYRGWLPPKYVWFTYSWYNNGWWNEEHGNASCSSEIITTMLNGSLSILPINNLMSDNGDTPTLSGLVSS